ncbi:MAG: hypothetical protein ACQESE_05035 [Nanobdellota archaeon]
MKSIGKLFKQLFESLSPNQYEKISQKLFSHSVSLYFKVLLLGLIIMTLLFIPKVVTISNSIEEDLDTFSTAEVSVDFETDEPVRLLAYPEIKVDSNASDLDGAFLTIGNENLYYRNYLLWGNANATFPSSVDMKENHEMISKLVNTISIVLIPGIIIAISLLLFLVSIAVILVSSLITFPIIKGKKKLSFRDVIVISMHSILVPVLLAFVLIPLSRFYWLSIVVYMIIFLLSMALVKGHRLHTSSYDESNFSADTGKKKKKSKKHKK